MKSVGYYFLRPKPWYRQQSKIMFTEYNLIYDKVMSKPVQGKPRWGVQFTLL